MLILAIESSAKAASAALLQDGVLLAENFRNNGKTHSVTLMPMVEELLKDSGLAVKDLDVIAAAIGPGSFTGIRIGVSAAKGLAWASEKPMCPVSTLEAMASQLVSARGLICPVMDARRSQVYHGLFRSDGSTLTRLRDDCAISLEELRQELLQYSEPIYLVGDGSRLCWNALSAEFPAMIFPPAHLEQQHASGVALAAERILKPTAPVPGDTVVPNYLRLSQAERERRERLRAAGQSEA